MDEDMLWLLIGVVIVIIIIVAIVIGIGKMPEIDLGDYFSQLQFPKRG